MPTLGREDGLAVLDDVDEIIRARRAKPSIWKLFRPQDITLYDLIYEPYLGPPDNRDRGNHKASRPTDH